MSGSDYYPHGVVIDDAVTDLKEKQYSNGERRAVTDFYEIDFLSVETKKSGDAIVLRYSQDGTEAIQVVDGGFTDMGAQILAHIDKYYRHGAAIDFVVLTHPDGDHAAGLKYVLENRTLRHLIMNRPWLYAGELLPYSKFTSVERLEARLREEFPHTAALEEIAHRRGVPIFEGFQGTGLGSFTILAPSKRRYLDLIFDAAHLARSALSLEAAYDSESRQGESHDVSSNWGQEIFSDNPTSPRNEMSIIQFATLSGKKIMLTGDAGRDALEEAVTFARDQQFGLPGIDVFQVPHHGSRRNVSTQLLNDLLGPILPAPSATPKFSAFVSSAKEDPHHPRKAVIRAMHHRGGSVYATEGRQIRTSKGLARADWRTIDAQPYPQTQEAD